MVPPEDVRESPPIRRGDAAEEGYRLREPRSVKGARGAAGCAHDRDRDQVVGAGS
jgi:hypothetical protein